MFNFRPLNIIHKEFTLINATLDTFINIEIVRSRLGGFRLQTMNVV